MRIYVTSVPVSDQQRAHDFYTEVLGFRTKVDLPLGEHRHLSALGVRFTQPPVAMGGVTTAVFDDTCGNLVQIVKVG